MTEFPEAGIKLVADTGDAYDSIEALGALADDVTSGSYLLTLETEVDTSGLDTAELPTDGETITQTVDIEETDTAEKTLEAVNFLKNTKILETVWNVVGTGVDLISRFGGDLLQPMLDLDDAVARVKAQTGETIPNARELIKTIFYDDLGESIDQVGNLIIKAQQLGVPIEDATRAALTFTHTFTDQNPEQVLNTLNQLVNNKLAPDFKTAGDILVTAFQNGANRGNDLLQALEKNATAIHNLGLTGPEALSFIKTGLDNGIDSANTVIILLEKIKQNVTNAAGNPTSDVSKTLRQLGIANPAETGEAWSADFFKAVIDKIANAPGLTDTQKETLFSNLAGGKQGGKTFAAFLQMSPEEADTIFANVKGAADRAAQDADDSLSGAFADFQLAVSEKVQDVLSSQAIDIPGKIKALKEGLQNGLSELAAGGSLQDALTIALKPIGLDATFERLESSLGNFIISILQVIQQIQATTGHGAEAEATGQTIHQMARQQLAFDLQVANPDEIAGVIKTAAQRGLEPAQIAGSISTAVSELVKKGAPEAAQAVIDAAKTGVGSITFDVQGELERKLLESQGQNPTFSVPVTPEMTPADIQKTIDDTKAQFQASGFFLDAAVVPSIDQSVINDLQKQVNDAFSETNPTMAEMAHKTDDVKTSGDQLNETLDTTKNNTSNAIQPVSDLAKGVDKMGGVSKDAAPAVADTAVSIDDVGLSAMAATVQMQGFGNSIDVVAGKLQSALGAADSVAQQASQQGAAANPDSGAGPHAMGGVATAALVGEGGQEIVSSNKDFAILNNKTTQAIMGAVYAFMNGSRVVSGGGGNTYVANNTNYVQSEAQADSVGYSTSKVLRGMG